MSKSPLIQSPGNPRLNNVKSRTNFWALKELSLLPGQGDDVAAAFITNVAICLAVLRAVEETDTLLLLSLLILKHCEIKLQTVASVKYSDLLPVDDREFAISNRICKTKQIQRRRNWNEIM